MSNPSDGALVPAQATQDIAWLRTQLAPAREPLAHLSAAMAELGRGPIADTSDERRRADAIVNAENALNNIEVLIAPTRSRIHAMRTELSRRVKLATEKPKDTIAQAKRVLGAWRARERVRKQAAAADARMAAARSETLADAAAAVRAAPEPTGAKGTRRQWKMEVRNEPALRASVIRLVAALAAQDSEVTSAVAVTRKRLRATGPGIEAATDLISTLYVNEGRLRAALANAEGAHVAELAGLEGIHIYSEDVAT